MPLMSTPFAQAVLLDHAAGHEGIGHLPHVVVVGIAEEAVAVGVHFQDAAAGLDRAGLAVVDRFDVAILAVVGRPAGRDGRAVDDNRRVDWNLEPRFGRADGLSSFWPFPYIPSDSS